MPTGTLWKAPWGHIGRRRESTGRSNSRACHTTANTADEYSVKLIATSSMVQADRCVERVIDPGLPLPACKRKDNSLMRMLEHLYTSYIPPCSSCLRQRKGRHSSRTGVGESVSVVLIPLITSADEPTHGESEALEYPRHTKNVSTRRELVGGGAGGSCLPLWHILGRNIGRGLPISNLVYRISGPEREEFLRRTRRSRKSDGTRFPRKLEEQGIPRCEGECLRVT